MLLDQTVVLCRRLGGVWSGLLKLVLGVAFALAIAFLVGISMGLSVLQDSDVQNSLGDLALGDLALGDFAFGDFAFGDLGEGRCVGRWLRVVRDSCMGGSSMGTADSLGDFGMVGQYGLLGSRPLDGQCVS